MKKIIICLCLLLISCQNIAYAAPVGYTNQKCYIYARPSTSAPHYQLARNTKLYYVSTHGKFFKVRVSGHAQKVYILKKYVSKTKTKTQTTTPTTPSSSWSKTEKLTWSKGKNVLKNGGVATLYDIKRGIRFKIKRVGGTNHMDVEPASKDDTLKLWDVVEGYFSWKCHPMILIVNSRYIACSINSMPHGKQSNKNNDFDGHFCLHLVNSKTHGTNVVNTEHQKQIDVAYKWAH